jgi:hypothetical protein
MLFYQSYLDPDAQNKNNKVLASNQQGGEFTIESESKYCAGASKIYR